MRDRELLRVHSAMRDDIGDLVTRRPLPNPELRHLDPFLFLNHHGPQFYPPNNHGLPFGPHPHRGFETVTFILEGALAHRDSGGHESIIHAGGVQWMTAGRGLVHAELSPRSFKEEGGPLEILQLWVNLPAKLKMTQPAYHGLEASDIPVVDAADGRGSIQIVSGSVEERAGAVDPLTDVALMLLRLDDGAEFTLSIERGRNVLFYTVRGSVRVGSSVLQEHRMGQLSDGDRLVLTAQGPSTVLLGHGKPFGEPIVAHGPFVMNSADEIRQAIQDYQQGRLGSL